ncbi:MAG TPA: hypothetical protein VK974_06160 [Methylophilaceae bacterium]|nr:hypothetical protein [Methylophilaceae bacterium]
MDKVNPQQAAHLETARILTMEMVTIATTAARELGYYGINDQQMISAVINAMASNYLAITLNKN